MKSWTYVRFGEWFVLFSGVGVLDFSMDYSSDIFLSKTAAQTMHFGVQSVVIFCLVDEVNTLENCVLSPKALICWIGGISYVSSLATRRLSSEHLGKHCLPCSFEQVPFFARIAIGIDECSAEARGTCSFTEHRVCLCGPGQQAGDLFWSVLAIPAACLYAMCFTLFSAAREL